jgi:hypothetical protein
MYRWHRDTALPNRNAVDDKPSAQAGDKFTNIVAADPLCDEPINVIGDFDLPEFIFGALSKDELT